MTNNFKSSFSLLFNYYILKKSLKKVTQNELVILNLMKNWQIDKETKAGKS